MIHGRPFEPGNKLGRGRPPGSKNKSTSVGRRLLEEHYESLLRKNIAEALKGDTKSRLWCLNELHRASTPAPKLKLRPCQTPDDIAKAYGVILNAVARNKCTDARTQTLLAVLGEIRKVMSDVQILARLDELEKLAKDPGSE